MKVTIEISDKEREELRKYLEYAALLKHVGLNPYPTIAERVAARVCDMIAAQTAAEAANV